MRMNSFKVFISLLLFSHLGAHSVPLSFEEWEKKYGDQYTERYGSVVAGKRMGGQVDGIFKSSDMDALLGYLGSGIPFYEQRNIIYVLIDELKKDEVYFSLEKEKEAVGEIVNQLEGSESKPDEGYRTSLLKNGLMSFSGYYDPRIEELSKKWSSHEDSYIREGAEIYLQFVSEWKREGSGSKVSIRRDPGSALVIKSEEIEPLLVWEMAYYGHFIIANCYQFLIKI